MCRHAQKRAVGAGRKCDGVGGCSCRCARAVESDRGQGAIAKGKRVREWARSRRLKVDGQRAETAGIERVRARLRAGGGAIEEKISAHNRGSRGEVARGVADVGQGKALRIVGRIQRSRRRGRIKGDLRRLSAEEQFLHRRVLLIGKKEIAAGVDRDAQGWMRPLVSVRTLEVAETAPFVASMTFTMLLVPLSSSVT